MTMPHDPAQGPVQFEPVQPQVAILPTLPGPEPQQSLVPVQPAPVQKKRTGVVVLSVVSVLLLGAAGAFGALFLTEKEHARQVSEQLAAKNRELTDANKKVNDGKDELTKVQDDLKKAQAENTAGTKCKDAARSLREAGIKQDEKLLESALKDLVINC